MKVSLEKKQIQEILEELQKTYERYGGGTYEDCLTVKEIKNLLTFAEANGLSYVSMQFVHNEIGRTLYVSDPDPDNPLLKSDVTDYALW